VHIRLIRTTAHIIIIFVVIVRNILNAVDEREDVLDIIIQRNVETIIRWKILLLIPMLLADGYMPLDFGNKHLECLTLPTRKSIRSIQFLRSECMRLDAITNLANVLLDLIPFLDQVRL
jgi:hypothetical protein